MPQKYRLPTDRWRFSLRKKAKNERFECRQKTSVLLSINYLLLSCSAGVHAMINPTWCSCNPCNWMFLCFELYHSHTFWGSQASPVCRCEINFQFKFSISSFDHKTTWCFFLLSFDKKIHLYTSGTRDVNKLTEIFLRKKWSKGRRRNIFVSIYLAYSADISIS